MSALQVINQIVEQEKIEKEETKALLAQILTKLENIDSKEIIKLDSPDRLLKIEEVCEITGFGKTFMGNEIRAGRLKKFIYADSKEILSRPARYKLSDVKKWINDYMVEE